MTAPETDSAQMLADRLDEFFKARRIELAIMCTELGVSIDNLIMDMLMAGYNEIDGIVKQSMENNGVRYNAVYDAVKLADLEGKE